MSIAFWNNFYFFLNSFAKRCFPFLLATFKRNIPLFPNVETNVSTPLPNKKDGVRFGVWQGFGIREMKQLRL